MRAHRRGDRQVFVHRRLRTHEPRRGFVGVRNTNGDECACDRRPARTTRSTRGCELIFSRNAGGLRARSFAFGRDRRRSDAIDRRSEGLGVLVFSILSPSASASSSRAQRGKETDGSISTRFRRRRFPRVLRVAATETSTSSPPRRMRKTRRKSTWRKRHKSSRFYTTSRTAPIRLECQTESWCIA